MKVEREIMLSITFNWTSLNNTGTRVFHWQCVCVCVLCVFCVLGTQFLASVCVAICLSSHTHIVVYACLCVCVCISCLCEFCCCMNKSKERWDIKWTMWIKNTSELRVRLHFWLICCFYVFHLFFSFYIFNPIDVSCVSCMYLMNYWRCYFLRCL